MTDGRTGELAGKVAIITGAASGIGAATARRFAELGAKVVLGDKNLEGAQDLAQRLRAEGCGARAVAAEVGRAEDNRRLVETALGEFGGLHIAVANAGIAESATPIEDVTDEQIDALLTVNLRGPILLAREVAAIFKGQRSGVFLATASTAAARPRPGLQVYSATKGALVALVRAIALEWAPYGARACAVSPVATDTPMLPRFHGSAAKAAASEDEVLEAFKRTVPLGRLARPEDIADGFAFLASERAAMITGTVLDVDGGRNI